jgi:hypothetical protein
LGNDNRQLAVYNGFSDICSGFDEKYLYASVYLTYGIGREPALAMDYDGVLKYYECDHLGSVRTIFDEDGNVLSDHEYEPFGNEFFDTKEDNRLSWIGKERDQESLLGYFGARKYDFLSRWFSSIDLLWEEYNIICCLICFVKYCCPNLFYQL